MILTEQEAKTKVCGMAMSYAGEGFLHCKASGCMGWRRSGVKRFSGPNAEDLPTGYCGHAGTPQEP